MLLKTYLSSKDLLVSSVSDCALLAVVNTRPIIPIVVLTYVPSTPCSVPTKAHSLGVSSTPTETASLQENYSLSSVALRTVERLPQLDFGIKIFRPSYPLKGF